MDQNEIIPAASNTRLAVRGERSIGTILIQSGRLTLEDAESILELQREKELRFGAAGIQLGLLTQADIDFALSRQFDHFFLIRGESKVSDSVVTAYAPYSPQANVMSTLRSQLMLRWFDLDPVVKSLAIISADRGEGRSYITANLAVAFAQLGQKTLIVDANMRHPVQHLLFGMDNRNGLSALLSGRVGPEPAIQAVEGLNHLSIIPAGTLPPNPLELLSRPLFPQLLQDLSVEFDVILLDSPASDAYGDAQTIAVRAGAALIVVRKNATRMWKVRGMTEAVDHASATIVGTVLNDF